MMEQARHYYWGKTLASFFLVLFTMPLGHAMMIVMDNTMSRGAVNTAGFLMGLVGWVMVVIGVFVKGDTKQTLWGLFGGLLFWTGWVEFLFQYYANRYGVEPEIENGVVVTKPEYLILPATFGLWMMVMTLYIFCTQTGCNFMNWVQRHLFGKRRTLIVARPMTRHVSIVTFMELNMILWTCYLLLMFCYDKRFLGDHHPVTFLIGFLCLVGSILMFRKELRIPSWGANIRMAIATVIVFWTPVEILGRVNFFNEIWVHPEQYKTQILTILAAFLVLLAYVVWVSLRKKKNNH
jgi:hypothetical protein